MLKIALMNASFHLYPLHMIEIVNETTSESSATFLFESTHVVYDIDMQILAFRACRAYLLSDL